ncbi:hypothetical protein ABAC460_22160 [Asticcacaulis sp. AC460]|nr:hypothetical protein ABAC460_22160 [Asticcacaulis sp. AC460]
MGQEASARQDETKAKGLQMRGIGKFSQGKAKTEYRGVQQRQTQDMALADGTEDAGVVGKTGGHGSFRKITPPNTPGLNKRRPLTWGERPSVRHISLCRLRDKNPELGYELSP